MSVAGLSSTSLSQLSDRQSLFQQRRSDFRELAESLQNGDLSDAQQAYNALTSLSTNGSGPFQNNSQLAQDFSAVGQALQSGDVASAQQAFTSLQQGFHATRAARASDADSSAQSGTGPAVLRDPGGAGGANLPISTGPTGTGPGIRLNPGGGGGAQLPISSVFEPSGTSGASSSEAASNTQPVGVRQNPGGDGGANLPISIATGNQLSIVA